MSAFHNKRLQTAAKDVEEEQWSQADIPVQTCREINLLVATATEQSSAGSETGATLRIDRDDGQLASGNTVAKSLDIEDQTFILVPATIKTLDMLCSYMKLLLDLDSIATDVMAKIIEFLKVSTCVSKP